MVEIFGKSYYIDLDGITDKCRVEIIPIKKTVKKSGKKEENENESGDLVVLDVGQGINIFKYELIKLCLERILMEDTENDESMGEFSTVSTPISFRIAFNTLIKNQILIEDDE
jgi:hypothetical protein